MEEGSKEVQEVSKEALPLPTIKIDNHSDSFSTIVKVDFGDRLGELLDTARLTAVCAQLQQPHLTHCGAQC